MPLMAMQNEFFFISSLHQCKIKAMDEVQLVIHACNIVAPYLHSRTIEYLQDISIEEVKPVEVLPIYPLMRSYLDLLVDYMKNGMNCSHYLKFAITRMKLPPFSVMRYLTTFNSSYPS